MRSLQVAMALAVCSLPPLHAAAAQRGGRDTSTTFTADSGSSGTARASAIRDALDRAPIVHAPVVHVMVFGDATYLGTNREVPSGFLIGQAVGHLVAALTERLAYFGEFTATAQSNTYTLEVERSILRYDVADELKLSGGRYHTPIGYWNTAFHHGTWLQTSVSRPEMVKFGSQFIPVHFVGAMAEGSLPTAGDLGLGYMAGVGNGRGSILARGGDAGDANGSRAWTASLSARPASLYGLQIGGGYYSDRVTPPTGPSATEGIASAYLAWQHESPELIAEYAQVRHRPVDGGLPTTSNHGYYAQIAYRLPGSASQWKPYLRGERVTTSFDDVIFAPLMLGYEGALGGVRYDFAPYAALKGELRRERFQGRGWSTSMYLNVSFTIPDLGGGEGDRMMQP
jgi:hypothetical protein